MTLGAHWCDMSNLHAIEIVADVTDTSVDQFVKSIALDQFIRLQDSQTEVRVCFFSNSGRDVYQPTLDVSLADAAISVDQAIERFRLGLFSEGFLQPLCASLLQGSTHPTRGMLEEQFESLRQLAVPAREEFSQQGEGGLLCGPKQREFESFAEDLVSLSAHLILSRVADQGNKGHLQRLLERLKFASM